MRWSEIKKKFAKFHKTDSIDFENKRKLWMNSNKRILRIKCVRGDKRLWRNELDYDISTFILENTTYMAFPDQSIVLLVFNFFFFIGKLQIVGFENPSSIEILRTF